MTDAERAEQEDDEEVARMAVKALADASRRARESGAVRVERVGDALVQIGPSGTTELKKLPPRVKVTVQMKRARK